jgi:hypothetical protein
MGNQERVFIENNEIVFEKELVPEELAKLASEHGLNRSIVFSEEFVERLKVKLADFEDLGEMFYQFLADEGEE